MVKQKHKVKRPGDGADRVYRALRRIIIEQTLSPGARLPEDAVAQRFGVSRTIVRAAITRLVSDGLVERPNNQVAKIASPTHAEADDLAAVRHDIESAVVSRLVCSFPPKQVAKLRAHVLREKSRPDDQGATVRLSGEFHVLLAAATGSKMLERFMIEIIAKSSLVFTAQTTAAARSCSPIEHTEIIDAILAGNADAARARMHQHLDNVAARSRQRPGPIQDFSDLPAKLIRPLT